MRKFNIVLTMAVVGWVLAAIARAQDAMLTESEPQTFDPQTTTVVILDTNAPKTKLEAFEAQTGTVIVKGVAQIGSMFAQGGTVSVRSKESKDAGTGKKEYGIAIGLKENNRPEDITIIDYDELDSLLDGIDYIVKINRTVSALPSFSARYVTKGGFRVAAYSSNNRPGTIQALLQGSHTARSRILLAPDQLAKFQVLVQQAKSNLDGLRGK
jgi:hypothetical protein